MTPCLCASPFQRYVTTDNPYDYVTMSIRMSEDDPQHGMKMKMLAQLGLDANDTYLLRNDQSETQMVPEALLRSLRVQLLSWGDAGKWRAVGEGKVVSLENELSVLRTVVGAVDKMLGLYPTTGADARRTKNSAERLAECNESACVAQQLHDGCTD